jgi:uncharacterized Zn-finger protein
MNAFELIFGGATAIGVIITILIIAIQLFLIYKFLVLCRDVGNIADLIMSKNASSKETSYLSSENSKKQTCKYCGEKYDAGQSNCPYCGKRP